MRRVLAVDGGQSGIRACHSDGLGPVEVEGVSRLEGDTEAAVGTAVGRLWAALGRPAVDRTVLGLTTAPADDRGRQRLCLDVRKVTHASEVWLADDAVTAHAGALSLGWGVSLTAGTGVACLMLPPDGEPRLIGGHGYLLGDDGGGWWIGRAGLRAVLLAEEERGPATTLTDAAVRRFGSLTDLAPRVHTLPRAVDAIARFAPDVLAAAEAGDPVAVAIVDAAADELVALIESALTLVGPRSEPVPVALGGGLLGQGILRVAVDRTIASLSAAAPRSADGSPLAGALLLGASAHPGPYRRLVHVLAAAA